MLPILTLITVRLGLLFRRLLAVGQWLTGRARWACLNCPRPNPPGDSNEREGRRYRPSLGRPLRTPSVVGDRPIRRGVVGAVSVAGTVTPSQPSRRGRIGRGFGEVRKLPRIDTTTRDFTNLVLVEVVNIHAPEVDVAVLAEAVKAVVEPHQPPTVVGVLLAVEDATLLERFEVTVLTQ